MSAFLPICGGELEYDGPPKKTATRRIGPLLVTPLAYLSGCGACGTPRQEPGKQNGWRIWGEGLSLCLCMACAGKLGRLIGERLG